MAVDFTSSGWQYSNRTTSSGTFNGVGGVCRSFGTGSKGRHPASTMPYLVVHNGTSYTVRRAYYVAENGVIRGAYQYDIDYIDGVALRASCTDASYAFRYARNLTGNIVVENSPSTYVDTFTGTTKPIYVVRSSASTSNISVWRTIASQYNNVHYEADDNPNPTVTVSAIRVASNGSTTQSQRGTWAYLIARVTYYTSYLPVDWTFTKSIETTLDGTTITPTWSGEDGTIHAWVDLGDTERHEIGVTCTSTILDEDDGVRATHESTTATQIIARAFATMDVLAGGEGIAFGMFATVAGLWNGFKSFFEDDATFDAEVYLKDNANTVRQAFDFVHPVGSLYETSDSSFDPNTTWGGTWSLKSSKEAYIVDEGTSGIWTYRKWSDGTAECWGIHTVSSSAWASWGSGYYSSTFSQPTFPTGLFIEAPSLSALNQSGVDAYIAHSGTTTKDTVGSLYLVRPANSPTSAYAVGYIAKGKWSNDAEYKYIWERTA